jgi:hypothetical protein
MFQTDTCGVIVCPKNQVMSQNVLASLAVGPIHCSWSATSRPQLYFACVLSEQGLDGRKCKHCWLKLPLAGPATALPKDRFERFMMATDVRIIRCVQTS